jgi:hypothetical protein
MCHVLQTPVATGLATSRNTAAWVHNKTSRIPSFTPRQSTLTSSKQAFGRTIPSTSASHASLMSQASIASQASLASVASETSSTCSSSAAQSTRQRQQQQQPQVHQQRKQPPQQQTQQGASSGTRLEAAAAAAANLLKAKSRGMSTPVAAGGAARADALHGGGTSPDQMQKRLAELEAQLKQCQVCCWWNGTGDSQHFCSTRLCRLAVGLCMWFSMQQGPLTLLFVRHSQAVGNLCQCLHVVDLYDIGVPPMLSTGTDGCPTCHRQAMLYPTGHCLCAHDVGQSCPCRMSGTS